MTALAAAGRHVEALRVYDDFRRLLADELGVEPSPALAARHVELLRGGAGLVRPRHRLPSPVTSFLGRDQLVADAVGLAATSRVVTLLGPGGVGKTRLLIEVGHRLLDAEPGAARRALRAGRRVADAVLDVVAAALGIDQRPNVPLGERIVALLESSSLVLLLDNCEHVLDAMAALVDDVVVRCPDVTILTSSRERLRVGGEQLCPVPPLPLAADGPAQHLFVDRAAAVRAGLRAVAPRRRRSSTTSSPASTACRWRSSSPRPASTRWASTRSPRASTAASGCSPPVPATSPATARWPPR